MTFLNSSILIGLAFASVPVILHFLMKQKPKRLLFPALQLIVQRKRQSVRRMRLKHFWLLLLRVLVLIIIVLAIARPSLPPANYRLSGMEIGILCAVCVIGIGSYLFFLHRLRQELQPKFQQEERQSKLRNMTTVSTLLAIAAFVGFPYQQRISGELTNPRPVQDINLPVAGIMLFDTSLSMSYLQEGKTALDQARDIAKKHLQSLPVGSRIAIADSSNDNPILFQSTMLSAQSRLDSLEVQTVSLPLDERLQLALKSHEDDRTRTLSDQSNVQTDARKDRYIRRVYVFTDLAKSAWKTRTSDLLKGQIQDATGTNLYLVDVGQEDPQNIAITDVELSRERIPVGGDLIVSTTLSATGKDVPEQTVELRLQNSQNQSSKVGQISSPIDAGIPVQLSFSPLSDLQNRSLHGEVRLATSDPLAFDNVRYFSAEVIPAPKVLVVGPEYDDVNEWILALAPHDGLDAGKNKFVPEYVPIGQLKDQQLSEYTAVTLINCPGRSLSDDLWFQIGKYVENGGGLIVILGDTDLKLNPSYYNRARAQVFLPASLDVYQSKNLRTGWRMSIDKRSHPMFWKFRQYENFGTFSTMENLVRIDRFWKVDPAEGSNVLATYTNEERSPALVERTYGRGRTVMLTTDASNPETRDGWSTLASLNTSTMFLMFVQQVTEYVSRFTDVEHNYLAGQIPVVPLEPKDRDRTIFLREPGLTQSRSTLAAAAPSIVLKPTSEVGHYDLYEQGSRVSLRGFSVNPASSESDLTRLTDSELDERFGEEKYEVARNIEELKDNINAADIGQEVFPMLLMLVVVIFIGEHIVANRFYSNQDQTADL
ncbi:BatA domain-containing protein [Thalassoglobus sp.]|uniref:BatA domain-containing protein n=1 Tax=Thalassoglobus sp. TaxID=2795869 RepID=UPI003AA7B2F3